MLLRSLLTVAALTAVCFGQSEAEGSRYYQLDFQVKQLEGGKVTSSRTHSTMLLAGKESTGCSIRSGNRVPYATGDNNLQNIQYMEVGVNIDCKFAKEIGTQLAMVVSGDISSFVLSSERTPNQAPVTRSVRWNSNVLLHLKKATVIFSSEDPGTKLTTQLEVTATPLKL